MKPSSFFGTLCISPCFPVAKTITQAIISTTTVRIAVPRFDSTPEIPTFPKIAVKLAKTAERAFVIGGGSVYRQMLAYCDTAYITKVHCTPESDTFFPNLDEAPDWTLDTVLQSGEEDGIAYEMCRYRRK